MGARSHVEYEQKENLDLKENLVNVILGFLSF